MELSHMICEPLNMARRDHLVPMEVDPASSGDGDDLMRRCSEFAQVTHTDNALAMMYLQDREWNLEKALSDYFRENGGPSNPVTRAYVDLTESDEQSELDKSVVFQQSNILNVLSWNIDGLDKTNFHVRLKAILSCLKSELPDIVCLQEVVLDSLDALRTQLEEDYHIFSATDDSHANYVQYFVALLVRKCPGISVDLSSFTVTPFFGSQMGRHTVAIDVLLDRARWSAKDVTHPPIRENNNQSSPPPLRLRVITAHLESCRDAHTERKSQLKQVWAKMLQHSTNSKVGLSQTRVACIFCGDLNLRDSEVSQLGGLPAGLQDVWEQTGARPELKSTWDPVRNSNAGRYVPAKHPQSHRFDRMYCCSGGYLKPIDFGLRGLERIQKYTCFPSDHWGILGRFVIVC
ncbi:tyrosyl-DNA phosphodiesterase 2 [Clonorchis sinensis]|uniref:Tyrosyl-DNA phosphodiesterase 2 n=1 Tax=Clonorchis sinensis TaxID=79923 RepID=G7YF76_CLOSI|nr:tyrosyl-DNA phosphodiesterase 2 [Clonorchis sinensis]